MRKTREGGRSADREAASDSTFTLERGSETRLARIARVAARLLDAPMAVVSVAADGVSKIGFAHGTDPATLSLCELMPGKEPLVVDDPTEHEPFRSHAAVAGPPGIRFFVSVPLCSRTGKWLGTLCVMDTRSRKLDPRLQAALTDLAALLGEDLEIEGAPHQAQAGATEGALSEPMLRSVLDNLFTFVGVFTVDGVLIEANRAPLEAAGLELVDVAGKLFWQCYWWSHSAEVQQELKSAVERAAQGERVRYDAQVRVKGGELIMVDFMLAPLRDKNGRITHLMASGVDISDRVRFEAELKRLVRIIEEAPDFIGSTDPSGRFTFVNPAGYRMIGLEPGSPVGDLHLSAAHPAWASAEIGTRAVPEALEKGTWVGETALVGAGGKEIPVSEVIIAHRNEMGRLAHLSLLARDVTERRRAVTALRQSETRFRGTFENAAVGIAHLGTDGRWLRVNQRLLDIVGYEREELLARTFQDITHPDDLPRDMEQRRRLLNGVVDSYVIEKRYFRKDGRVVWVHKTVARQRTEEADPPYTIAVIEDITDRKEAEERQRVLLAELNHRVKNTLATIQSIATQTLRRTTNPQEFAARFIGRLQSVSGVHNLLTERTWEGAELEALVLDQVHLSGMVEAERISVSGPSLILPPQIALNLAMLLHELATNAVKHGSLSQTSGRIDVTWTLETGGQHPVVRLVWSEFGGPPPQRVPAKGFGTLLLERGLEQGLGGEALLDWRETGLVATLSIPIPAYTRRKGFFRP